VMRLVWIRNLNRNPKLPLLLTSTDLPSTLALASALARRGRVLDMFETWDLSIYETIEWTNTSCGSSDDVITSGTCYRMYRLHRILIQLLHAAMAE
jgi:hypothetical protein